MIETTTTELQTAVQRYGWTAEPIADFLAITSRQTGGRPVAGFLLRNRLNIAVCYVVLTTKGKYLFLRYIGQEKLLTGNADLKTAVDKVVGGYFCAQLNP
jgi:hypothetical protein